MTYSRGAIAHAIDRSERVVRLWHLMGALLVAASLLLGSVASAQAGTTPVSSFSKTGRDTTNGSTTAGGSTATTAPGHTIDWVLTYRNKTGSEADVTITDPIQGNQTFVPGSLKAPPGMTPQWSTNGGTSFVTTQPGSGVNAVGVTGKSGTESTASQQLFSPPANSFNAGSSQGDGWEALFIDDKIYNVHHHRPSGGPATLLDCHIKATGAQCPGYSVDYVSPNAGDAFGTGPDVLTNPTYNNGAVDAANGRIFIPVGTEGQTDIGVLCIDVTNSQSCGYTQLGDSAFDNNPTNPGIAGGAQVGNHYYVAGASDGAPIYCYDISTMAQCDSAVWPTAGVPSDASYAPASMVARNTWEFETYGGYLFPSIVHNDGTRDISCIVEATGALCPGFPVANVIPVGGNGWGGLAPTLDSSGAVTGICAQTGVANTTTGYMCWSVADGSSMGAAPFDQMVPNAGVGHANLLSALQIGSREYFAYTANGTPNGPVTYTCYDFATSSACQGFTPVPGGDLVRPYTIRQDPYNKDCLWELGDAGKFQVFSATFGGSLGCNEGNAQVSVKPTRTTATARTATSRRGTGCGCSASTRAATTPWP